MGYGPLKSIGYGVYGNLFTRLGHSIFYLLKGDFWHSKATPDYMCAVPSFPTFCSTWGLPRIRGPILGGPYNKEHHIWGSILGSAILADYQVGPMPATLVLMFLTLFSSSGPIHSQSLEKADPELHNDGARSEPLDSNANHAAVEPMAVGACRGCCK